MKKWRKMIQMCECSDCTNEEDARSLDELAELIKKLATVKKVPKYAAEDFIANHNEICYCEAIINPEGLIGNIWISHTKSLIGEMGLTEDEVYEAMPISESPIHWLIRKTGCVAVWYNFALVPSTLTKKQIATIKKLKNSEVVSKEWELIEA